jgi:hypothetical protein
LVKEGFGKNADREVRATGGRTDGLQTVEFIDSAAVVALRLGRVAQAQGQGVGFGGAVLKSLSQDEVAVLHARDFDIGEEDRVDLDARYVGEAASFIEAGGEEAGFQAGGAEHGLLGEGDSLDGEDLLGVDGLVEFHGVVLEVGDLLDVFEADDGVSGGGESVFAGVLSGTGLAFRRAGAGGLGGIGSIGGELLGRDVILRVWHMLFRYSLRFQSCTGWGLSPKCRPWQVMEKKGII